MAVFVICHMFNMHIRLGTFSTKRNCKCSLTDPITILVFEKVKKMLVGSSGLISRRMLDYPP